MFSTPLDANGHPLALPPAIPPRQVTYDATISAATSLTLQVGTTLLEVSAIAQGIFMRYQAAVSTTLFDEFIQAGMTRHYVVPPGVTVVSFLEETASARLVVVEK